MSKFPGRLAMREEGPNWNAYFAKPNTMDGAIYLGSVKMSLAHIPAIKEGFIALMQLAIQQVLKDMGTDINWPDPPKRAPEHERAGNA